MDMTVEVTNIKAHATSPPREANPRLLDAVAHDLSEPSVRRRTGEPDTRSAVKLVERDTFWALAREKYNASGAAQVDAMLAILELNGLDAHIGMRKGKAEWIAETFYANRNYQLPAAREIPELAKRFLLREAGAK